MALLHISSQALPMTVNVLRGISTRLICSNDSSTPMPKSKFQKKRGEDITVIGVPLTEMGNNAYTDPRQRHCFKNIIYVGALSALRDIGGRGSLDADREAVSRARTTDPAEHPSLQRPGTTAAEPDLARSAFVCAAPRRSVTVS